MIEVYAQLSCDGPIDLHLLDCETESLVADQGDRNSVGILRRLAKSAGWKRIEGYDLCPHCAKKYKKRTL